MQNKVASKILTSTTSLAISALISGVSIFEATATLRYIMFILQLLCSVCRINITYFGTIGVIPVHKAEQEVFVVLFHFVV